MRSVTFSELGNRAIGCLEKAPLRALDAIRLASALDFACDLFLTADRRQYEAAMRSSLNAEEVAERPR